MYRIPIAFLVALSLLQSNLRAADEKPKADPPAAGEVRTQTLQGFTFFYKSIETSFQTMGDDVKRLISDVRTAAADAKVQISGPMIMEYHGVTGDPNTKFTLDLGYKVDDDAKGQGDAKVKKMDEYHCLSVLYAGPLTGIMNAYNKLLPLISDGSHEYTMESREMYLYFEAPDSPNNVTLCSVGIKKTDKKE